MNLPPAELNETHSAGLVIRGHYRHLLAITDRLFISFWNKLRAWMLLSPCIGEGIQDGGFMIPR